MKSKFKFAFYSFLLILFSLLYVGCGTMQNITSEASQANFRTLSETSKPGCFQMSYEGFDGSSTKTFAVTKGSKITFNYDSKVKDGSLTLVITDPFGTTVGTLPVNKKGTLKIVSKGIGKVSMIVTGKNTTGSFKILWK